MMLLEEVIAVLMSWDEEFRHLPNEEQWDEAEWVREVAIERLKKAGL